MDNRKVYEYINSKATREHLTKLDYQLTPVQCAFLVWQSGWHTLRQKHEAWRDIIESMPDCAVEDGYTRAQWDEIDPLVPV